MEKVVGVKVQRVDEGERRGWPVDLDHRNSTVEGDDPIRLVGQQLVIELHDLRPVRGKHIRGVAVNGVDSRLDLKGAGLTAAQASPEDRLALGDEVAIPEVAVLVGQSHQVAVGARAGGPARLDEQHER